MVYSPIDPDALLPGAKIIASLALQTRDNPLAVAQALASVPTLQLVNLGLALRTANMTTNQVLKSNGAGGFKWGAEPSIVTEQRTAVGSSTWVVPTNVFAIEVQMWGGGGGYGQISNWQCGASGAYVRATLPTTPGETLTYAVGAGGVNIAAGGMTLMRNAADTVYARAGGGGIANGVSPGGVASVLTASDDFIIMNGREGPLGTVNQLTNFRAIAPMSWNGYGAGGFSDGIGEGGKQGYLRWRYVQP